MVLSNAIVFISVVLSAGRGTVVAVAFCTI